MLLLLSLFLKPRAYFTNNVQSRLRLPLACIKRHAKDG
jgi:hypothetical protein